MIYSSQSFGRQPLDIKQLWRFVAVIALIASITACGGGGDDAASTPAGPSIPTGPSAPPTAPNPTNEDEFVDLLRQVKNDYALPATAGMLMYNGEVIFKGVTGERAMQSDIEVTESDLWHLGSITKSMTATLAARLVEKSLITWETRISDVFPDLIQTGNGQFDHVTLVDLLSHHSGLQRNIDWTAYSSKSLDIRAQRRDVVAVALRSNRVNNGDEFHYSNLAFVVAGAMLEAVAQKDWETLMREELFEPLAIDDAGFGAPGDGVSQPNGHLQQGSGYMAVSPQDSASDNPAVIGPAGTVHMSLDSIAKYARAHMLGELGESSLLSSATFGFLHQPVNGSDYSLGWFLQPDSIFHDGSNNLWYAKLGISIEQQIVVISITNAGGQNANEATDVITNEMLRIYFE